MSTKAKGALATRIPGPTTASPAALLAEIRTLVLQARQTVAQGVNSALVLLYWQIGQRIHSDILKAKRAEYGEQIVDALSGKLSAEFGRGFTRRNLFNMVRCAEAFPDLKIVHALRAHLSWTHLRRVVYIDDPLKRDFYAEMCRIERWNTRTLHDKIQSMLYERTALSKKPDLLSPDILCAGQSDEHVELMDLHKSGIHLASYLTKLLPKKQLVKKLHQAVRLARQRLQAGQAGRMEGSI